METIHINPNWKDTGSYDMLIAKYDDENRRLKRELKEYTKNNVYKGMTNMEIAEQDDKERKSKTK